MSPYDFVSIDFETANNNLASACSIGLVAVRDLKIVKTFYSLIKPKKLEFSINAPGLNPSPLGE